VRDRKYLLSGTSQYIRRQPRKQDHGRKKVAGSARRSSRARAGNGNWPTLDRIFTIQGYATQERGAPVTQRVSAGAVSVNTGDLRMEAGSNRADIPVRVTLETLLTIVQGRRNYITRRQSTLKLTSISERPKNNTTANTPERGTGHVGKKGRNTISDPGCS